jgi:Cof subfamily protein (haloacid dehalogenase superfamily)
VPTPRLAAIDLDGTLVRSDGTLSQRTIDALASTPLEIVLVSARGPRGVAVVVDAVGLSGTAIASNGAAVVDLATRTVIRERSIETEVAATLVQQLRERLPGVLFGIERDAFAHERGFSAWDWTPPPDTRVADALELLDEPPRKLVVRHADRTLDVVEAAVREVVGERCSVSVSGDWVVEISAAGVNKAAALAEVCAGAGVDAADVVAFGDHRNDVPMLAWAGHAVAVANAHPDAIDVADEVTASNDEDGVALVLERYGSVSRP